MEQTVENKNKSGIKTFLVIILFAILLDMVIFIMNRFIQNIPYMSTIFTVALVVLSCSYILIKFFSKYLYIIENGQIIFYMLIGKKKFESLRIDLEDLVDIKPYIDKTKRKSDYKFIYDKNQDKVYIGRYKNGENISTFLFSPNEKILRELKKE